MAIQEIEIGQLNVLTEDMRQVDEFYFTRTGADGLMDEQLEIIPYQRLTIVMHTAYCWHHNLMTGSRYSTTETRRWQLVDEDRVYYNLDLQRRSEYQARQNAERRERRLRARAEEAERILRDACLTPEGKLDDAAWERRQEIRWRQNLYETIGYAGVA